MAPWYFADISSWEPNAKVSEIVKKGNGVISMRVGYGSMLDTKWRKWREQAKNADAVLLYHFAVKSGRSHGLSVKGNAEWFVQEVGRLRKNEVPVLDVEGAGGKWSKADCLVWIEHVHSKLGGPRPMIYANQSYIGENGLSSLFTVEKGWVAKYGMPGKATSAPTHKWVAWQLSDGNYGTPRPSWPGCGAADTNRVDVSKAEFLKRVFKGAVATTKPSASKLTRVLKYDPKNATIEGPDVMAVQKRLIALGYKLPRYGADGGYGAETVRAVRSFQKDKHLMIDGEVYTNTWTALFG